MSQRSPRSKAAAASSVSSRAARALRRHLAELQLDRLVLADRLAEGLAHLGVLGGELERAFRHAHAARRHVDAAELQPAGRLVEALALLAADQVVGRQPVVLEHQLAGIDRLVAELLQLAADREARLLGSDEHAHALVAWVRSRVGLYQQRKATAFDAVGDPGLGAVDDVVVAIAPRRGADALQVRAGVGLRQRQAAAHLAAGELRQPCILLLRGAEFLDRQRQHQVRVENPRDRHPVARDAHDDLGVGPCRQSEPTVFRRDRRAEQPQLLHLLDRFGRIAIGVVVFLGDRLHLLLDPPVDGGEQLRFVIGIDVAQPRLCRHGASCRWLCGCGPCGLQTATRPTAVTINEAAYLPRPPAQP